MKKISYLIIIILMLTFGINSVNAEGSKMCYYMSSDNNFKATLKIRWQIPRCCEDWGWLQLCNCTRADYSYTTINKIGPSTYAFEGEPILNWYDENTGGGVTFSQYYSSEEVADNTANPNCPKYIVMEKCSWWNGGYKTWVTESESIAQRAVAGIKNGGCEGAYGASFYKDSNGNVHAHTKEEYYAEFQYEGLIEFNENNEPTCAEYDSIFGDKNDPDSFRGIADTILSYVRVIIPIIIILLGTLDLSKAVLAGKEDNIKKAQTDFAKRIIIGVAIFFIPVLVDAVMYLADIVWDEEYFHCDL